MVRPAEVAAGPTVAAVRAPESHPRAPLNNVGYNAGEQVTPTPPSAGPPIGPSAKAHGISDQRIWEAYRNPVAEFVLRNGVTIRLGYDSQATCWRSAGSIGGEAAGSSTPWSAELPGAGSTGCRDQSLHQ